jgi:hypothetical protein
MTMTYLWRSRYVLLALLALVLQPSAGLAQGMAEAAETGAVAAAADTTETADTQVQIDQLKITIGGVFNTWFQNQRNFSYGAAEYKDRYVVQMLRFNASFGWGDYAKAVTRLDVAQGWWGVNNESWRDASSPNASNRWSNKDTNYSPHVDHGYLEFTLPKAPLTARVGRMYYGAGNKIILDSNFDGIQADVKTGPGKFTLGWAKVSEGLVGLGDIPGDLATNRVCGKDADLLMATFDGKAMNGALSYGVFGMRFDDKNFTPMYPQKLDYFVSRFTPAISTLNAVGMSAAYDAKAIGVKLEGEASYLTGTDEYKPDGTSRRSDSGANQMLDVNDGTLGGYNLYAKATKLIGRKTDIGLVAGRGSGDDDPMSGRGNVNKFKTMGFFYITELWDDSVMPDEEGITPQGLGAPNIRGYRELENTTILQANVTHRPFPGWRTFASASMIRATQPIRGWTPAAGGVVGPANFTSDSSNDIGREVDLLIGYQPYPRLDLVLRGGYFWAGDAARLLTTGRTVLPDGNRDPYELKAEITFRF